MLIYVNLGLKSKLYFLDRFSLAIAQFPRLIFAKLSITLAFALKGFAKFSAIHQPHLLLEEPLVV